MANEVEKQTLNFFAMAIRESIGSVSERGGRDGNEPNFGRLILAAFFFSLAFIFCGAEAMKVIFRRDFAKDTVGIVPIIVAAIAFIGWGGWCIGVSFYATEDFSVIGSPLSFAVTGVFYLILGIRVWARGAREWNLSNNYEGGTALGKATLLSFLIESGWSEYKSKQIGEPLIVLALGILFSGINILWGIPLLFCAVSMTGINIFSYMRRVESAPLKAKPGGRLKDNDRIPQ